MAYPFVLVEDPALDRQRQAQENPYYILRRYGFWQREFSYQHSGASDLTESKQTTVGLTAAATATVKDTASIGHRRRLVRPPRLRRIPHRNDQQRADGHQHPRGGQESLRSKRRSSGRTTPANG